MTRDESLEITNMVLTYWRGQDWTKEQIDAFARSIAHLKVDIAMSTIIVAARELKYRPSIAEFMEMYRAESKRLRPQVERPGEIVTTELPFWVKRWMCARLLYEKFGKERDDRRFPEQQLAGDLTAEQMPEGEWVAEAEKMSDGELMAAFRNMSKP